jgi:hypothetical protein
MAAPYFEKKRVILCRSGRQAYTNTEIAAWGLAPVIDKDVYTVYRPAYALISAAPLMKNLPIAREHPPEFINGDNWNRYSKGYTGSEVEIVGLGDGEIGVESTIFFSTSDIYNYYLDGSEEVSLGYRAHYSVVENPEEVGYDIILDDIFEVNHLAVTKAGRGGPKVSVIDSLLGGLYQMKTGLLFLLKRKGKTQDAQKEFLDTFVSALKEATKLPSDKVQDALAPVIDSVTYLKDGKHKQLLVDMVTDCFNAPKAALENKDALLEVVEKTYKAAVQDSIDDMSTVDEDGKGTGTANISDTEEKDEEKKEGEKKGEEEKKDEEGMNEKEEKKGEEGKKDEEGMKEKEEEKKKDETPVSKDSIEAVIKTVLQKELSGIEGRLKELVAKEVKTSLGLSTDSRFSGAQDSLGYDLSEIDIRRFLS